MKDFFSELSLEEMVQIIADLSLCRLFPSDQAFARLFQLEKEGKEVEEKISAFFDGAVLRAYQAYKHPADVDIPIEVLPEATQLEVQFALDFPRGYPSFTESLFFSRSIFERIKMLQMRDVPVFTMMYARGQKRMADAYRKWLFAQYA